jgi:hypothetical protein
MNKGYILLLARRPAGVVARSLHTTRYARRSRQNATFIHYQALSALIEKS